MNTFQLPLSDSDSDSDLDFDDKKENSSTTSSTADSKLDIEEDLKNDIAVCLLCGSKELVLDVCASCWICLECFTDETFVNEIFGTGDPGVCYICSERMLLENRDSIKKMSLEYEKLRENTERWMIMRREKKLEEKRRRIEERRRKESQRLRVIRGKGRQHITADSADIDFDLDDLNQLFNQRPVSTTPTQFKWRVPIETPLLKYKQNIKKNIRKLNVRSLSSEILDIYQQKLANSFLSTAGGQRTDSLAKITLSLAKNATGVIDDHLHGFAEGILNFAKKWKRIKLFGIMSGVLLSEEYNLHMEEVFTSLIRIVFEDPAKMQAVLGYGDGSSWIRADVCTDGLSHLFQTCSNFKFLFAAEDCKERKVTMPWLPEAKAELFRTVDGLRETANGKGYIAGATKGNDMVMNADLFLFHVMDAWLKEYQRLCSAFDAEQTKERLKLEAERSRRNRLLQRACERPFTPQALEILTNCVTEYKLLHGVDELPSHVGSSDVWHEILRMTKFKNRKPENLLAKWNVLEQAVADREAMKWDYTLWEWNFNWEFGGLRVVSDPEDSESESDDVSDDASDDVVEEKEREDEEDDVLLGTCAFLTEIRETDLRVEKDLSKQPQPQPQQHPLHRSSSNFRGIAVRNAKLPPIQYQCRHQHHQQPATGNNDEEMASPRSLPPLDSSRGVSIDIRYYGGGRKTSEALCEGLDRHLSTIHDIDLSFNTLNDSDCSQVLSSLRHHHMLQAINLGSNLLSHVTIETLVRLLNIQSPQQALLAEQAEQTRIHEEEARAAAALAAAAAAAAAAEEEDSDDAAVAAEESPMKPAPVVVVLPNKKLMRKNTMALKLIAKRYKLVKDARVLHSLKELNLSNCKLGNVLCIKLIEGLISSENSIRRLDLGGNNISDIQVAHKLGEYLTEPNALRELLLSWNSFNIHSGAVLADALGANTSLAMLDLKFNNIKNVCTKQLCKVLQSNSPLTALDISYNNINSAICDDLATALLANDRLEYLNISGNNIGVAGIAKLNAAKNALLSLSMEDCGNDYSLETTITMD